MAVPVWPAPLNVLELGKFKQKERTMDFQSILIMIAVGAVAGLLADWLIKGIRVGLIGAIIVGVLGGFIGGWLFGLLKIELGLGILGQIIAAFVGAVILLLVMRALRIGRRR
jgi:uncharacterized membrane protein YeaQ/YmgE (transglycosylase-associated protein family)